jgi:DNA recombination-dependent growth factor C
VPEATDPSFAAALKKQRFRTIEDAASEETSAGWVSPTDPTGETYDPEQMVFEDACWLRMRTDKKSLPARWVSIYRSVAEHSAGRKLTARERRDLKQDLMQKLLPRILPTVQFVDAVWYPTPKKLLLLATSTAVRENFQRLFETSFEARMHAAGPLGLAVHGSLTKAQKDYLRQVAPIRWPSAGRDGGDASRAPNRGKHELAGEVLEA